jgi:hypothetical protein
MYNTSVSCLYISITGYTDTTYYYITTTTFTHYNYYNAQQGIQISLPTTVEPSHDAMIQHQKFTPFQRIVLHFPSVHAVHQLLYQQ